jgi:chemotaxis protein MotB
MARRGKRRGGHESDHPDERWLVSYADMVTLLMALFIVMFSMANVNTSKYDALKESLAGAFSPSLLPGGTSVASDGGPAAVNPAVAPASADAAGKTAAERETESLRQLKERVDAYAREHGLSTKIAARIERRGLVITVLTDKLLFDSGHAALRSEGGALLQGIGGLLRKESEHRVVVEGYTDPMPISSAQFPSNWELSTARASTVVRALMAAKVAPQRLTAAGRAHLDPIASNATAEGRSRNRRVQIVLPRQESSPTSDAAEPTVGFDEPEIGPQESTHP